MREALHVLILEDVWEDAVLIQQELRVGGLAFEARCAQDKAGYLRDLAAGWPDVILADYHLPDMDGEDAIAIARESCPGVPVIVVSGAVGDEQAAATIRSGAVDYVLKDRLKRLVPAVHSALAFAATARENARLAEELRLSEARFRALIQSSFDATVLVDEHGGVRYASPSYGAVLGYSPEELLGLSGFSFGIEEEAEKAADFFRRATGSTRATGPERFWVTQKDGNLRRLEVVLTNRLDDPALGGIIVNLRDVTEPERIAAALESRDRILAAVASAARDLLVRDWRQVIGPALAHLGAAARVSRARLCALSQSEDGSVRVSVVGEWCTTADVSAAENQPDMALPGWWSERWIPEMEAGRPIFGRVRDLPRPERALFAAEGVLALADVPVRISGKLWGFIALHDCQREREWSAAELEALSTAADMLGAAMERERLMAELDEARRHTAETLTLLDTLQASAPVGFAFVDRELRLVRVNEALAALDGHPVAQCVGRRIAEVLPTLWRQTEQSCRRVRDSGQAVLDLEVSGETSADPGKPHFWLANIYPVAIDDATTGLGVVVVDITERTLATKALVALTEAAIGAVAAAVEARDPYTAGHQRRVAHLAVGIASELGLEPGFIEGVRMAASIHDIGKISVPAEILSKPGRLSPAELALVRQHAQAGYDIVKGIDFDEPIAEMIRQHHERMDGSGYPSGLVGEEITVGARIIAVADVVEAMSSHRPYHAGLGVDAALDEIRHGAGPKFDASAAEACLRLFAEGRLSLEPSSLPGESGPGLGEHTPSRRLSPIATARVRIEKVNTPRRRHVSGLT